MYSQWIILGFLFTSLSCVYSQGGRKPNSKCPRPTVQGGRFNLRSKQKLAKFTCDSGLTLMGSDTSLCENGMWIPAVPKCIGPICPDLVVDPAVKMDKFMRGGLIQFSCKAGYIRDGPETLFCSDRIWSEAPPKCLAGESKGCDFEDGRCGWSDDMTDDFDWTRNSGPTPTAQTGPKGDHTKNDSTGYYLFIETSISVHEERRARFLSPYYPEASLDNKCLVFYYHMYGESDSEDFEHVGSLEVLLRPEKLPTVALNSDHQIFYKRGNQGDRWVKAEVMIPKVTETVQIVFQAAIKSWLSDIAIDDISITDCSKGEKEGGADFGDKTTADGRKTQADTTEGLTSQSVNPKSSSSVTMTTVKLGSTPKTAVTTRQVVSTTRLTRPTTTTTATSTSKGSVKSITTAAKTDSTVRITSTNSKATTRPSVASTSLTTIRSTRSTVRPTSITISKTTSFGNAASKASTAVTTLKPTSTARSTPVSSTTAATQQYTRPSTPAPEEKTSMKTVDPVAVSTFYPSQGLMTDTGIRSSPNPPVGSTKDADFTDSGPRSTENNFITNVETYTRNTDILSTVTDSNGTFKDVTTDKSTNQDYINVGEAGTETDDDDDDDDTDDDIDDEDNDSDDTSLSSAGSRNNDTTNEREANSSNTRSSTEFSGGDSASAGKVHGDTSGTKELLPLIIGVVSAVVIGAIVIGILTWRWAKHQRMKQQKEEDDQMNIITEYVETTLNV